MATRITPEYNGIPLKINQDGSINTSESNLTIRVDDYSTSDIIYLGKAIIASLESDAVWQIKKIDTGTGVEILYANGSESYNTIWDNRLSLSYS